MTGKNSKKGGLGKGLAALIPERREENPHLGDSAADILLGGGGSSGRQRGFADGRAKQEARQAARAGASAATASAVGSAAELGASYQEISVKDIVPNAQQPRSDFDEDALNELAHSIKEFGLLQPIVVRPIAEPAKRLGAHFEIIMGERRWRAARKAGLDTIPAIVRETEDSSMLRDALLENIHRVELNPLEEAAAYQQLLEEFDVTQAELAEKLGRSRPVITNTIRLLQLPVGVQRKVAARVISSGHARALLGLKDRSLAEALCTRIIAEGLSVRATEEAVTLANRGGADEGPAKRKREPVPLPAYAEQAAHRLADGLDTKVTVNVGKKKGKIVVEFSGREDFERIVGLLEGH
ncbi:MAG: ParB/RepB/Spo0J family partition protein [Corynebacterium pyruviciproducens]|uniref:ParB/RepB/Spo0J family partition protein n=1 Tax=Corynebacterium pyruviciproducens TaxID=598660 RepID=UPI00254A61AB|nr:ParB/RepB/Spo0J family partition protein [Corynebacterium pyruviciproducens]MDK6566761.1 ParB/RepB/Spo0J family partition protein [Corynebacterium pyruviciproducens]